MDYLPFWWWSMLNVQRFHSNFLTSPKYTAKATFTCTELQPTKEIWNSLDLSTFCAQFQPFLSVLVIVVSPVIVLMLYPSCFKVVSFFKLEEFRCVSWLLQRVPHALLKLFADSFQSCFKDNMRFFAGLYFAYRIIILIGWFAPTRFTQSYLLWELILVTTLVIHALPQPYNNRMHNILDTLLFLNLVFNW